MRLQNDRNAIRIEIDSLFGRAEIYEKERRKQMSEKGKDQKYSCHVCGHCSNFLRGMYCEDASYDDEICGRFKLDEKRKEVVKKEMENNE